LLGWKVRFIENLEHREHPWGREQHGPPQGDR
jgi:hypothetical protein